MKMTPSASLLLLLLLGLSQAHPLLEEGDQEEGQDLDQEEDKDLDQEEDKDLDQEEDKDLDQEEDKDLHQEEGQDLDQEEDKDLDQEEDKDLDQEEGQDLDQEEDKDLDQEEDKDLDQEEDKELDQEEDKDLDQEEGKDPDTVDITTTILTTNNGSREFLMEGDLVMPTSRNVMCWYRNCLWQKSYDGLVRVPYVISSVFGSYTRLIQSAMRIMQRQTCIRFVPRRYERDYVSIENRQGCYSSLGRVGGRQVLSLNMRGCLESDIIQHELNHVLAFKHEQTRSDRDNYVRINWGNIKPSAAYNFEKHNSNTLNTPYDYSSLMHYHRTAFSINGRDTITPIPNPHIQLGQKRGLSHWDVKRINLLYHC